MPQVEISRAGTMIGEITEAEAMTTEAEATEATSVGGVKGIGTVRVVILYVMSGAIAVTVEVGITHAMTAVVDQRKFSYSLLSLSMNFNVKRKG
mmetsp:Transcript_121702/g.192728  ORF Transcript_121702/g.192728 Transcript_121702/m.192728 type:complete len:94 (+) Transcript_121702:1672-1953(+)